MPGVCHIVWCKECHHFIFSKKNMKISSADDLNVFYQIRLTLLKKYELFCLIKVSICLIFKNMYSC